MLPFPRRFRFFVCSSFHSGDCAAVCNICSILDLPEIIAVSSLDRTLNWLLNYVFVKFTSLFGASFYSVLQNAHVHTHTHTHTVWTSTEYRFP